MDLPKSACDDERITEQAGVIDTGDAYIRNPITGREMLTPMEALNAISVLSATLISDERYRGILASREVPDGN